MTARILVVCTANICRSPMAERLLQAYADRHGPFGAVAVTSAGTHARPGQRAAEEMRAVAASWGLDLGDHRSRRLDAAVALAQDLVVTMEDAHRSVVSRLAAGLGPRTFTITELAALVDATSPDQARGGLAARVGQWHAARARTTLHAPDVADPYGGAAQAYRDTAWELVDLVEQLGPALTRAVAGHEPRGR